MPVRLRGHHFLCILTYRGYGYSPAFVHNMTTVVADIASGRPVRLAQGPDDICAGLSADDRRVCDHDCARAETRALDRIAVADVARLIGRDLAEPIVIGEEMVASLRGAFAEGSIRGACRRCPWADFCSAIAEEGFSGTRLFPPLPEMEAGRRRGFRSGP